MTTEWLRWEPDMGGIFAVHEGYEFFKPDFDEIFMCRTPEGKYGIGFTPEQAFIAANMDMKARAKTR